MGNQYGIDLGKLSDYQILELSKDKTRDNEFNNILYKIISLASFLHFDGEDVKSLVHDGDKKRENLAEMRENFYADLQAVIIDRDVSESKMKNALGLKIDLPKFSGYECKMDFYTFKTKFRKLVEPTIRKQYLAD